MLQIKRISKEYVTGDLVQSALDGVSLNLRDNEFVAILGPSGSGKTTLLNIIGGLDRYDTGDLIIDGVSTRRYKDKDWDSYRNHTIGFVFQSYNLIPHQSVLANVELALTISGISKRERKQRALAALEEVGLLEHKNKKPNQLSGGQMQRVAIARALVNNPKILLADEPTGALDTETSIQVMDLLKEVAKDRLVVMVTHNPELAEQYATRIVKVRDGVILSDTDPYEIDDKTLKAPEHKNLGKASMGLGTSLTLSFNNLRTKFARTFLTALAGSIGIIGIALILSLSNGVNKYIEDIQKDTMTSYPIVIEEQSMDLSSFMQSGSTKVQDSADIKHKLDAVYVNNVGFELASSVTTSLTENNLTKFKEYLDKAGSEIHQYIGDNGIVYRYNTKFDVFAFDPDGNLMNTDGSTLDEGEDDTMVNWMTSMTPMVVSKNFSELLPGTSDEPVSDAIKDNFGIVYGHWPRKYNQVVLVLDKNHEIGATQLYQIGVLPLDEHKQIIKDMEDGKELELEDREWEYDELCEHEMWLIPACDRYAENESGNFDYIEDDEGIIALMDDAIKLEICGVIVPQDDDAASLISGLFGYTRELTDWIIEHTEESSVVLAQEKSETVNVLNGMQFDPESDDDKISDLKDYIATLGISEKAMIYKGMASQVLVGDAEKLAGLQMMTEVDLANALDEYIKGEPDKDVMLALYDNLISSGSYDDNMEDFGVISLDAPSSISIYADTFEAKDQISECIDRYNDEAKEKDQISYTDYVGLLMSSVTTIIDVISYVLVAFVSVSLVVSSIMIGIITYISVLERTKEIGILRAIGASKHNISQVFNAETFIIGLFSGVLGIVISLLAMIPGNAIIHSLIGNTDVNAYLQPGAAIILIALSVVLTLIGGFLPAKGAAKKDPVAALRTE